MDLPTSVGVSNVEPSPRPTGQDSGLGALCKRITRLRRLALLLKLGVSNENRVFGNQSSVVSNVER